MTVLLVFLINSNTVFLAAVPITYQEIIIESRHVQKWQTLGQIDGDQNLERSTKVNG